MDSTMAYYFRRGIEISLLEPDEAKTWASRVLETTGTVDVASVASASSVRELLDALREAGTGADSQLAGRWLLHDLAESLRAGRRDLRGTAQLATWVSRDCDLDDAYARFNVLDDRIGLAESGTFGNIEACSADLLATLVEVAVFRHAI